jgi:MFS family permease
MTVKFFPVFFRSIYDFQPIAVQLVIGTGLAVTAFATWVAQRLSRKRGRGQMIVLLQGLAIACLVGMASYPAPAIVVLLFVMRGALMNATTPLSRTIVMDYVPRRRRGVWSSLQTVAWGLFWNASALIGGFLVGDDNFRRAFLVTSIVYVFGTAIVVPFIRVIHKERDMLPDDEIPPVKEAATVDPIAAGTGGAKK